MATETGPVRKKASEDEDSFMVTYVSLMILLLTFMILMVTLAQIKEPRFRKAIGSVKGAFSFMPFAGGKDQLHDGSVGFLPQEILAEPPGQGESDYEKAIESIRHKSRLDQYQGLEIEETRKGLRLRISDALLFGRGKAELKEEARSLLDLVADAIEAKPGRVMVVGHTCDLPISTPEFPSNWELSITRAVNVVHYLESLGVPPDSLYAFGLADQQPLVPNDSEANRRKNRRVEIFITYGWEKGDGNE